jgi:hypothetical protein
MAGNELQNIVFIHISKSWKSKPLRLPIFVVHGEDEDRRYTANATAPGY